MNYKRLHINLINLQMMFTSRLDICSASKGTNQRMIYHSTVDYGWPKIVKIIKFISRTLCAIKLPPEAKKDQIASFFPLF